jgi:hypothetical protein
MRCTSEQMLVIDGCCGAIVGFLIGAGLAGPTINSITFFFLVALLVACVVRVRRDARGAEPVYRSAPVVPALRTSDSAAA